MTEHGTKTSGGVATGVDHIKDLGITHLHILPMYDYGSVNETKLDAAQFNWGYDPVNYNVPEGKWHVCINGEKAGTESIEKVSEKVSVEGISAMVLVQGENAVTNDADGGNVNASEMVAYLGVAGAVIATSVVKKRKR